MTAKVIDGKLLAKKYNAITAKQATCLQEQYDISPCLAVILVGDNPASEIYIKNKIKKCDQVGIKSIQYKFPADISESTVIETIQEINDSKHIHGLLVQLPLPKRISQLNVINAINPDKDVDGFTLINIGRLVTGIDSLMPCTPIGCMRLIESVKPDITGLNVVVVGRSSIVGKPVATLLLQQNATVTIAHSKTKNLAEITKKADILIAAIGRPNFFNKDMIKKNAIVIDVGINWVDNKIVGDVNFEEVKQIAEFITPVPGGVGPMTIAMLMQNTIKACCIQNNIELDNEQ